MALKDSLQGYWKLEEASGNRVDSHGANTLTDNNTVTSAVGKIGTAGQFTAANSEFLSVADNAALSMGNIDFAMAAWVYFDTVADAKAIISKGNTGTFDYEYLLRTRDNGGNIQFFLQISDGSANEGLVHATTFGVPSTATWYWVFCYHDATANTIGISVNNGTVDTTAYTFGSNDGAGAFNIGAYLSNQMFFNGRIDEVAIWKRVPTTAERTEIYNGGNGLAFDSWDVKSGFFSIL